MKLTKLKKLIREFDPNVKEGSKEWNVYLILLASAFVGPSVERVCEYTGLSEKTILPIAKLARKNKIWVGKKIHANWMCKDHGGVALALDVSVCLGLLKKVNNTP